MKIAILLVPTRKSRRQIKKDLYLTYLINLKKKQ